MFLSYDSIEEATDTVKKHKIDAVWVFKDNFDSRINEFVSEKTKELFIEVTEREDTVLLQLSREILYGSIFKDVSYHLYKNYAYENIVSKDSI